MSIQHDQIHFVCRYVLNPTNIVKKLPAFSYIAQLCILMLTQSKRQVVVMSFFVICPITIDILYTMYLTLQPPL